MRYVNPVVKGYYPDPSVCYTDGKYYMVCSSCQYFPGVPLFESENLVNWKQIGYVLTRPEQVMLDKINSSGGVFAPTIRFHEGRFYMVTTNDTTHSNFYVYTDDIYGEWSDPIDVDQGGIDPSLYFEGTHTYFISNGADDEGVNGVTQCEIEIATGKKLSASRCIWQGSGGRFLESPHMYRIGSYYYLMAAEGGTEYGHMITCARAESVWGSFEGCPHNPIITNRNKAPYIIQGIGHGDLICDTYGDWHILCLGFRQQHIWRAYHHLGREVFLVPAGFDENGWLTAGTDGTAEESYEIKGDFVQKEKRLWTFENTDFGIDWSKLRKPIETDYELSKEKVILHGSHLTLDDVDAPTFLALRQRDFQLELCCEVKIDSGEGGITFYMTENEHYDLLLRKTDQQTDAILKLNIGGIKHEQTIVPLQSDQAELVVRADAMKYEFFVKTEVGEQRLGSASTKYLSSEVAEGFTGTMMGLYAVRGTAEFTEFSCSYY